MGARHTDPVANSHPSSRYVVEPRSLVEGNHVRLLNDGVEVFPEIRTIIANATLYVHIEMYYWNSDVFGWEIADLLASTAQRGVLVRLIVDAAGCINTQVDIFDSLEKRGVHIEQFHPLAPWRPRWSWNNRNHRKVVIADGKIAIVGGLNISGEYAVAANGVGLWRDCAVRIEGPAVDVINRAFSRSWTSQSRSDPSDRTFLDGTTSISNTLKTAPASATADGIPVAVIPTGGQWSKADIDRAVIFAIRRAKSTVSIACAYFIPGASLRRALRRAAQRGVDVRILLPSESMDIKTVYYATRHLYGRLLKSNLRIYEWSGEMLHSKLVIVDSIYVLVGSANLDPRSRYHNHELSVAAVDPDLGQEAENRFRSDLDRAQEITRVSWKSRGFLTRMLERIAFWFRYWL